MAHREQTPYRAQDPQEVLQLVQSLNAHAGKGRKGQGGFSVRKNTYNVGDGRTVDSWRMQDWDYKKPNLPTYARGLFTYKNLKGEHEIAVRGYDKFFNHGEVRKTEWRNVERNTRGPYELSVKENGCIIFIAGLDDGKLLVCSKHSTGHRDDATYSHAEAGERWVDKHLETVGKTREQLALKLREMNATAVAELCDDAFEEHVLAYNPESAGLYLHGINVNVPEFVTYPGHLVDRFAAEWGMKKTVYVMEDDISKVHKFLDNVAVTGSYNGRETEGFVIRCQARDSEDAAYEDWFFKYKFEEPYLMYRQWRECTKAIIGGREPRYKKHKKITAEYLEFARRRFAQNPGLAQAYNQNHGIISLRDDFLKERGVKGSDIIRQELDAGEEMENRAVTRNVVLVPVATIGCGKTTVALGLVKLFDWGHIQNDNIQGKARPKRFADAIISLLEDHAVVIADRNNHQERERDQIFADVRPNAKDVRFVALHYVHDPANLDIIRKTMRERVLGRGDNHQTIQAASKNPNEIIDIMEGFIHRFQPVDHEKGPDDNFDLVINLDVTASSRENLETVVSQLHAEFPALFDQMPAASDLDEAIEWAMNDYRPGLKHEIGKKGGNKSQTQNQANGTVPKVKLPKVDYFAVQLPAARVSSIVDSAFRDQDPETARFFRQLQHYRRVQPSFHVTLIHRASAGDHPQEWARLLDLHDRAMANGSNPNEHEFGKVQVQLERIVWDSRVMCIVVRLLNQPSDSRNGENDQGFQTVNKIAHITIGTASQDIKPKESNDLLQKWVRDGSGHETGVKEMKIQGNVVLDGVVKAVGVKK